MAERPVDWTNSALACLAPFTFNDFTGPFNLKSRRFTRNPCLFKLARDGAITRKSTANVEKVCNGLNCRGVFGEIEQYCIDIRRNRSYLFHVGFNSSVNVRMHREFRQGLSERLQILKPNC